MASHESNVQFESRKRDHIRLALSDKNQALGESGLERIALLHEALPELNFSEVSLEQNSLKKNIRTPFLVSSMTAGHAGSGKLNALLAKACEARGWRMGVGSQRRELGDKAAANEWREIRKSSRKVQLLGNLGLAQLIRSKISDVQRLVDNLEATAMIIHLNALQECLQPEGTPDFRGGLKAIQQLTKKLSVPVVVKETGCGMSAPTLKRLKKSGVRAVDVSGLGGTHWGRIEGDRATDGDVRRRAATMLASWGISTVDSVLDAVKLDPDYEVWASGGVRSGVDAAKLLALGATCVGVAMPVLDAALKGETALGDTMAAFEFELKTAMFCTGSKSLADLQRKKVWQWRAK